MTAERIFRVTVRGRFSNLRDEARASLAMDQDEHDVSRAAYSAEGTLTYDRRLDFFSLRYEIRCSGERAGDLAVQLGLRRAEEFLNIVGLGHRNVKATAIDLSSIWADGGATSSSAGS
jgi:Family of unknown function (DUF6204)